MKLGCALLTCIAAMVSAVWWRQSAAPLGSDPFVLIAKIGRESQDHVTSLLGASGIPVSTWGGRGSYRVEVPGSDALRAIGILRKDVKDRRYFIRFGDLPYPLEEAWLLPWADAPYPEILKRPAYASSTAVGECLRLPEIAVAAAAYSTIDRIAYRRYPLFQNEAWGGVVEEISLEKFPEGYKIGKRRSSLFQVFEGRRVVHCVSDRESEP